MSSPRHILAHALGVLYGTGCRCVVCGPSPFDAAPDRLPDTFTDFALLADHGAVDVCVGCARLMRGRPGDQPPPLRTVSVRAHVVVEVLDRSALWRALAEPLEGPHVVSWARSMQRHHWLRAGISTSERLLVGSDDGTIEYVPRRDAELLDAVRALLAGRVLARDAVRSGQYHPAAVAKFGIGRWSGLEEIARARRPSALLDMLTEITPAADDFNGATGQKEDATMMLGIDEEAADLLAHLVQASEMRRGDGVRFWGGFFRHRLERFKRLSLSGMVSRLLDECRCPPTAPGTRNVLFGIERMGLERQGEIERAIRDRPALIVALAFERMKAMRGESAT